MKYLWHIFTVAALLAALCAGAAAQRYQPPGGGDGEGNDGGNGTPSGQATKQETPAQSNPDPFGLTLAISGTAAAATYMMRQKRRAS